MSLSCLCLVLSLSLLKFRLNLNLNQVFMGADYCSTFALQTSSDCGRAVGDTGPILPGPGSLRRGAGGTPDRSPSRRFIPSGNAQNPPSPFKKNPQKLTVGNRIRLRACVRASERACVGPFGIAGDTPALSPFPGPPGVGKIVKQNRGVFLKNG